MVRLKANALRSIWAYLDGFQFLMVRLKVAQSYIELQQINDFNSLWFD